MATRHFCDICNSHRQAQKLNQVRVTEGPETPTNSLKTHVAHADVCTTCMSGFISRVKNLFNPPMAGDSHE